MMLFSSVLITGCGSDIGQGLCRILKITNTAQKVIGCDIHEDHLGRLMFDSCVQIPRASDPGYFEALSAVVRQYHIDLIIPASEAEISRFIVADQLLEFNGVPLILANKKSIQVGLDKLKTANFLKENGLAYPWTIYVKDGLPINVPCILKMRQGQGSKNIVKIEDMELAKYYQSKRPDDIWQELLLPNDQEYTCGLYRSLCGEIRTIAIKRTMLGGLTNEGIVVSDSAIDEYLKKIAVSLDLYGSINVQLRLTEKGPIAFEINPRFSSTVVFRHLLGFQDFLWSLLEKTGLRLEPYNKVKAGIRFYRLAQEYIVK